MSTKQFSDLVGQTLTEITNDGKRINFSLADGSVATLYHEQDCCEFVGVEDVTGDLQDLIGAPILRAEESISDTNPEGVTKKYQESFTWTFYRISTIKGTVVIRFYGESNGYYSESVDFSWEPRP